MEQESAFSYKHFQCIAAEELNDKANESIRDFLKKRWLFIKNTGWAYLRHPFLPINQLCLQIAGKDEAICQVLMPGIRELGRISASTRPLKKETEDNGHFPIHNYLLAENVRVLLPLETIYIDAVADTNCLFSDFQANTEKLKYSVQSEDLWNIRQATGESSALLMDKLFQVHKQQHDNGSLGFAIKNLAQHILKRSNLDAGTIDTIAEVKLELVTEPIREFYTIWRALPKEIKNELFLMRKGECQSPGYPLPLFFFRLFASVPDCPLEEEEWVALQKSEITECAVRIAYTLNKFLSDYGLNDIPVLSTSQRKSKAQINSSLLDLLENTLEAIKRRGPVFEIETPRIFSEFITFMRAVETSVDKIAEFASPCVYSFKDLATLTIIPDLLDAEIPQISPRKKLQGAQLYKKIRARIYRN